VEAVAAHEVAHVRCKHTLWLAMAMLATVTIVGGVLGFGGALLPWGLASTIGASGATVGSLVAGLLVMGLVSRRFEWQADAFAAKHMTGRDAAPAGGRPAVITPEAVAAMAGALQTVADLNGIPADRSSFRHGSIAARQRRLRDLIGTRVDRVRIDRQVGLLRVATLIALVAAGALITLGYAVN
jgi:Zn-dependent protease with chaperone function